MRLAGEDITGLPQHKRARLGMARTFQTPALFKGLTVLENMMTGRYLHGRGGMVAGMLRLPHVVRDEIRQRERVEEILELLEIAHLRHHGVDRPLLRLPEARRARPRAGAGPERSCSSTSRWPA